MQLQKIMDYLYPPRCPVCDRISADGFCRDCREKMPWIGADFCLKCGKPLSDSTREYCDDCLRRKHEFVQGRAILSYQGDIRPSLYRLKYANRKEYASVYGAELADRMGRWIRSHHISVIVPVPLHRKRRRERGYNQAALLARSLGKALGLPVEEHLLYRIRYTSPQKELSGNERQQNLKQAFEAKYEIPDGMNILLVDDIYTTGSTVDDAARALHRAGRCRVFVLCVAIGG